ncbi:MAG: hypothetical protein AAGG68_20605 [Bacteroidota bacterium]
MKSFKHWKFEEVEDAFGLTRVKQLDRLTNWMNVDVDDIPKEKRVRLEQLRANLWNWIDYWNEEEIKVYFMGPLLLEVEFGDSGYRGFWERSLSVAVAEGVTSGIVDFMLAKGRQIPKAPYFCIHEYKPEVNVTNDPIGQLLIAMVAAQAENAKAGRTELAIYGSYTIGRNWYFVVLDGNKYAISNALNATQEEVYTIFQILQKTSNYADVVAENDGH